ncbi:CPBP family intramembrane glutamic endopeptidase [Anditalea andensis]|uniref:Peptidase n=1 Tax=Anditalea andensis TaxID=1048983 RepID=A0A074KTJ1_9BACT|nr:CPBP family intramembrane glutamic endopeptidase [Anditalea andensis]KEO73281.1 peptidase [Anditalea andensis]
MEIYETQSEFGKKQYWLLSLVLLVLTVFGTLAILQSLFFFLVPILFNIPLGDVVYIIGGNYDHPNARMALLFIQVSGLSFWLGGYLFLRFIDKATLRIKQQVVNTKFNLALLVIPLLVSFIVMNSIIIYWNAQIQFPEFMSAFEEYAKRTEAEAMRLTTYLTDFENFYEYLASILVIGIFAGIGEEYLFRGILQPKLHQYTGNAHLGIWIAAFIFSAIHVQFYGFFPRLLLGALFGYLYLYSGSLFYPMLAHMLNNSLTVTLVYLNKLGIMEFNIEEATYADWYIMLIGFIVFLVSFKLFINNSRKLPSDGQMEKSF